MNHAVALYLPMLMKDPDAVPAHLMKDLSGTLDSKGVLHILKCPPAFLKSLELLIRYTAFAGHLHKKEAAAP